MGNLPGDVRTREVEDIFDRYGRIRDIHIKPPRDERHRNAFAFKKTTHPLAVHPFRSDESNSRRYSLKKILDALGTPG